MRKRLLNPDLFRDEDLASVPIEARYLYTGLWCIADREGRLEDRPARICADVFPYDNLGSPMVDQWLTMLHPRWIIRYTVDNQRLIFIKSFAKHQRCHVNEARSVLPPPPEGMPMDNHGSPLADQCTSYVDQCTTMVSGIRYTVNGKEPPIAPQSEPAEPLVLQPPSQPKRKRPADVPEDFPPFWALCPRKVGKEKALKAWRNLPAKDRADAMAGMQRQAPRMAAKIAAEGTDEHIPHPATWLNGRRWEDQDTPKRLVIPASLQPEPEPKRPWDEPGYWDRPENLIAPPPPPGTKGAW